MEYYRTLYKNTCTNGSNGVRGHDGNFPIHAWQDQNQNQNQSSWDLIRTYHNNNNNINNTGSSNDVVVNNYPLYNALSFAAAGAGGASHARTPDPHLTCLKLGKRDYFEDVVVVGSSSPQPPKKGKAQSGGSAPRCQVEGCESALASAKDYHRRHKVCEMHAKAPSVVVHGMEQRFCQQCSRFHAVVEFDDSKRSCRRRLAGHNERRRKQSTTTSQEHHRHSQGKYPHSVSSSGECALSLLSSSTNNYETNPWNYASPSSSSDDLPARCSAALRELIAENRASVLACRQLVVNPNNNFENCNTNNSSSSNNAYRLGLGRGGPKLSESGAGGGGHVTLDLMQDPDSAFGLLSVHDHGRHKSPKQAGNNNGDQDCSDLWRVPLGY